MVAKAPKDSFVQTKESPTKLRKLSDELVKQKKIRKVIKPLNKAKLNFMESFENPSLESKPFLTSREVYLQGLDQINEVN